MKKRTAHPFYGKREQRREAQLRQVSTAAAVTNDKTLKARAIALAKQLKDGIVKRMAASAARTHAPWAPMPRKGFHMHLGQEVANG